MPLDLSPTEANKDAMARRIAMLFDTPSSLVGPGYSQRMANLSQELPLQIQRIASGTKVFDWTVPQSFKINDAYVVGPDGKRYLEFSDHPYRVWSHSEPFCGRVSRTELLQHLASHPQLPDAIPLKIAYYQKVWGLAGSQREIERLPDGDYDVVIDVEKKDGHLEIGSVTLPGEVPDEILISSYLCHPKGANDNQSGVTVATELFRLLSAAPDRYFTYRLALWPETIGSICFIHQNPDVLKRVAAGFSCMIIGDNGPFLYKRSFGGNSLIDRAAAHALKHSGQPYSVENYSQTGSDERQFNAPGMRLPYGLISRGYTRFAKYHSSADDLTVVTPDNLFQSLRVVASIVETLERCRTYKPNFVVEPSLSSRGIYPYDLGAGDGLPAVDQAQAYYDLMGFLDGETDMLGIAERQGRPVKLYDRPLRDFLRTGLAEAVPTSTQRSPV